MGSDGFFFDCLVRQPDYDEDELDELDLELNLEEFIAFSEEMLVHYAREVDKAYATGRSVTLSFAGSSLGDIANVPAPFLKEPKGIRDIEEWYISTSMREDYVAEIFKGQVDVALENLKRLYVSVGDRVDTIFLCGTDFGTQNSTFCSAGKFAELWKPEYRRMTGWIHEHTGWKVFKQGQDNIILPLVEKGDIEVVHEDWVIDWSPSNAKKVMNAALTKVGNNFDAVLASNDGTAGGAIQALKENDLAGKVIVTGQDADEVACQRIVVGTQSMTIYKPIKNLATKVAQLAVALGKGENVMAESTADNGTTDVPTITLPVIVVDKDNMMDTVIADGFQSKDAVYCNSN